VNTEQFTSHTRTILKVGGGVMLAEGFSKDQLLQMAIGLAFVILGAVWSHFVHTEEPQKKP